MDRPSDSDVPDAEIESLIPRVYDELHRLAQSVFRGQPAGHTLQPTALVHEAYLRLSSTGEPRWNDRKHFFRIAAWAMRQVLVNHARDRSRLKRGGGRKRLTLDEALVVSDVASPDLESLDEALEALAQTDWRLCRVVELRYFIGLTIEETADVLGVSPSTVKNEWALARAWLHERLSAE